MRKLFGTKRRKVALVIALLTLLSAGSAVAYFTLHGTAGPVSSQTSAIQARTDQPVNLSGNNLDNNQIGPGVNSHTIQSTINTMGAAGPVTLGTLTAAIDPASLPVGCDPTWFTVTPSSVAINTTYAANMNNIHSNFVVTMPAINVNQDACAAGSYVVTLNLN